MRKNKHYWVGILIAAIFLGGCSSPTINRNGQPLPSLQESGTDQSTPSIGATFNEENSSVKKDLSPETLKVISKPSEGIIDFSPDKYQDLKGKVPVALFFFSNRCTHCRQVYEKLQTDKALLPGGIVLYKVDFDQEKGLREEFEAKEGNVIILNSKGEVARKNAGLAIDSIVMDLRKVMEGESL